MSSGGGGGGGDQRVTSTVTQSNLPAYVQPYFEQVLQRGLFESARPYQTYGGQRLAQFAPEETFAQRSIMGLQRPEQTGMASGLAAQVGFGQMPGYQAGQLGAGFEAGSLAAPGAMQQYMSPYMQSVVEQQKQAAVQDYQRQLPSVGAAAVRAGAKGGTREALVQAEAQRGLQQQLQGIEATGRQQAFEQARAGFEADRAARARQAELGLTGFQAQEAARQRAAELGLTAQGQRLTAAELLSGIGGQQQQMDLQRLAAQQAVGQERRNLMQQGLGLGYEDFLRQQAYGREQLGYLSNLLQGVPITPGSTVSTFGRVPSAGQQALGAGLGALGMYQAFGGAGGGGGRG